MSQNNLQINQSSTVRQIVDSKGIMQILACSESHLIKLKKRGKIPYLKLGNTHRYDVEKVIKALEINTK